MHVFSLRYIFMVQNTYHSNKIIHGSLVEDAKDLKNIH